MIKYILKTIEACESRKIGYLINRRAEDSFSIHKQTPQFQQLFEMLVRRNKFVINVTRNFFMDEIISRKQQL